MVSLRDDGPGAPPPFPGVGSRIPDLDLPPAPGELGNGEGSDDDVPIEGTVTNTRFAMPAMSDPGTDLGVSGSARVRESDAARRRPAPVERRPTMMGLEGVVAAHPKTVRPGVMDPVRPRADSELRDVGADRESSDVIQTFRSGGGGDPQPIAPPPADRARGRLERRPPRPALAPPPARPALAAVQASPPLLPPAATVQPRAPALPIAAAAAIAPSPSLLPLDEERLAGMIAEQRRHLYMLDTWARALEVGAGVVGSLSLIVAVIAVVASLLATSPSLLAGAAALVGAVVGLGVALGLVVFSAALRQLAHLAAQQAALLEALCQPPR